MKKKALCAFLLIFWMLAACTFLSMRVEELMLPQVTVLEPAFGHNDLPISCVSFDETGPHLYSVYEGSGWEAGSRVAEVQRGTYRMDPEEGKVVLNSYGSKYVQYASKPLVPGELVEVRRGNEKQPDRWLAVFPQGAPALDGLPEGITLEEQSATAVLLAVESAETPYMDGRAKDMVPQLREAGAVYSFAEMQAFLDGLPQAGLVLGMLVAAVVLWVCACLMAKEARRFRTCLLMDLGLGLLLLVGVFFAIRAVELPSSLLPREQITQFGHFIQVYNQFFNGLKSFAPPAAETGPLAPNLPQSEAARAIIGYKNITVMRPFLFVALGVIAPLLITLVQRAVLYWRSRPRLR